MKAQHVLLSMLTAGIIDQPNASEGKDYLSMAEAWFNDHFLVVAFTALFLTGLTIVALVAGYRRRRGWR